MKRRVHAFVRFGKRLYLYRAGATQQRIVGSQVKINVLIAELGTVRIIIFLVNRNQLVFVART